MRKDTEPGYSKKSRHGTAIERDVKKHNCIICRHPEKTEVERKYADGWLVSDIVRQHPWIHNQFNLQEHLRITGIKEAVDKKREIDTEEILERIVRAGLPVLEEGKVYPRDMIEAIKAWNELKGRQKTSEIWRMVEFRRNADYAKPTKDTDSQDSPSRIGSLD